MSLPMFRVVSADRKRTTGASSDMNSKPCPRQACPAALRRKRSVSGCHDNLQQPVAPRRQGPWSPAPSHTGVFGSPPLCAQTPPTLVREYLLSVAWQLPGKLSFRDASLGSESSPSLLGRFLGRRPAARSTTAW